MNRVEGKVGMVSGGALGIGKACALLLAKEGATVVVTDVKADEGQSVADEIRSAKPTGSKSSPRQWRPSAGSTSW